MKLTLFAMFYDLKVTYGNLGFYHLEDLYKATYSPNVMKISTRLHTVLTYALDWATIVAHIPWISQPFFRVSACLRACLPAAQTFIDSGISMTFLVPL